MGGASRFSAWTGQWTYSCVCKCPFPLCYKKNFGYLLVSISLSLAPEQQGILGGFLNRSFSLIILIKIDFNFLNKTIIVCMYVALIAQPLPASLQNQIIGCKIKRQQTIICCSFPMTINKTNPFVESIYWFKSLDISLESPNLNSLKLSRIIVTKNKITYHCNLHSVNVFPGYGMSEI